MVSVPHWAERLQQDEVWWNSQNVPVPLVVMDRAYRANALRWLYSHAAQIAQTVTWRWLFGPAPRGDAATGAFEAAMEELERDPAGYLTGTPLVRALLADDLDPADLGVARP